MSVVAYLALGSNLGRREYYLEAAKGQLLDDAGIYSIRMSRVYETDPVGSSDAPASGGQYLNAVAEVVTDMKAMDLLKLCLEVEAGLGRVRGRRNEARPIDLDLLLYGDAVLESAATVDDPELVVPHPRMLERTFVLEPLMELAAEVTHPVTGLTIREHWSSVRSEGR